MRGEPTCPRCGGSLHAPGLWSSTWQCDLHGAVPPLQPVGRPSVEVLTGTVQSARVPVWLPWPLPHGWLVTGMLHAGDERSGWTATAVACSGPAPLGGAGDLLLIAEEPGVGLGARFAGLPGPDPGTGFDSPAPQAKVHAAGHPTALWSLPVADGCAAYVGEACGIWLWAVLWPSDAGLLLQDHLVLIDLRNAGHELDVPFGALTPRLTS
ncbi:MAG: DUF6758 family protein [Actinomycetes bacterium]